MGVPSPRKTLVGCSRENKYVIRLPEFTVLRLFARSLLLAVVILSLPWIGGYADAVAGGAAMSSIVNNAELDFSTEELIPAVFKDFVVEGLLVEGDDVVFMGDAEEIRPFIDAGTVPAMSIFEDELPIADGEVDFVFTNAEIFKSPSQPVNRILRTGGIAAIRYLTDVEPLQVPANFKIVYLRRFDLPAVTDTVIAIRKTNAAAEPPAQRSKPGLCPVANHHSVSQLEDVLLEPPQSRWISSGSYLSRVRYLPEITGDDLQSYSRHVYIELGGRHRRHQQPDTGIATWFRQNYPARGRDFEFYSLAADNTGRFAPTVAWSRKRDAGSLGKGLSQWLMKNVAAEEFVVMKIDVGNGGEEFEILKEMVRSRAVCLVNELFLVCDHEGREGKKGKRAYWECLAMYGMLREGGVVVHQWWG